MVTPAESIRQTLFTELIPTALEIIAGQLGLAGIEPISRTAGRLLLDQGVVGSLDEGVVLFHEAIAKGRPNLGKTLRKVDRRAGRLPRAKLNVRAQLVKAGLAPRTERVTKGSPKGRLRAMTAAEVTSALRSPLLSKRTKDIIREQQAIKRKLKARR